MEALFCTLWVSNESEDSAQTQHLLIDKTLGKLKLHVVLEEITHFNTKFYYAFYFLIKNGKRQSRPLQNPGI